MVQAPHDMTNVRPGVRAHARHRWIRSAVLVALALLTVAALLLRIPAVAEPLGIDQSLWASAVRAMSRGELLYRDVWEQRPPGIYWIYLAGFQILGWTASTVVWLDILAAGATTTLLFTIARRLTSTPIAMLTAALYTALTMPAWLYGYGGFLERSVCESFIVVCVSAAAWCATRLRERDSTALAMLMGLAAGAAVVLKPNAGLYFPALLFWTFLYRRRGPSSALLPRWTMTAIATSLVIPVMAVVWLWSLGILQEARIAVIDFNRYYVSQGFAPAVYAVDFSKAAWLRIKTDPLWLAGAAGSVVALTDVARFRRLPPMPALALIWGSAAAVVIIVNGARLFNSYFINALPPLAIVSAWLLAGAEASSASTRTRSPIRVLLAAATGILMVVLLVERGYADRVLRWARADSAALRGDLDPIAYLELYGGYGNNRGYSARANAELVEYIRAHTVEEDRVFLFGINGAGVYFGSDRLPAHRFLRVNFFVDSDFPDSRFRLSSVVSDLRATPPRYIIFERLHSGSTMARRADALPQHPELRSLLEQYRFDTQIEDFALFRRID